MKIIEKISELKKNFPDKISFKKGFSEAELRVFSEKLPSKNIPYEITELLCYTTGLNINGLGEISFIDIDSFGFEEFFPSSIELLNDGFGNSWIIDINKNGIWGNIFFVCHDPPVIIKQANDLNDFLELLEEFLIKNKDSLLVNTGNAVFTPIELKDVGSDDLLKTLIATAGPGYKIADLRKAKNGEGFEWGSFVPEKTIRHSEKYIWAVLPEIKKGFFGFLKR